MGFFLPRRRPPEEDFVAVLLFKRARGSSSVFSACVCFFGFGFSLAVAHRRRHLSFSLAVAVKQQRRRPVDTGHPGRHRRSGAGTASQRWRAGDVNATRGRGDGVLAPSAAPPRRRRDVDKGRGDARPRPLRPPPRLRQPQQYSFTNQESISLAIYLPQPLFLQYVR